MNTIEIENKAKEVLTDYGLNEMIPFDPVKLAKLIGIEVKDTIFKDENIAGAISKRDGQTVILVNSSDPYNRKRFTIAHELGHYFLHLPAEAAGEYVDMYRSLSGEGTTQEKEANAFSAALLMDEVLVKVLWEKVHSIEKMAEIFKVSFDAMGYRLNNLKLI